jgi:hypothetical protein
MGDRIFRKSVESSFSYIFVTGEGLRGAGAESLRCAGHNQCARPGLAHGRQNITNQTEFDVRGATSACWALRDSGGSAQRKVILSEPNEF